MPVPIPGPHLDVLPVADADFGLWGTNLGVWMTANPTVVTSPSPASVVAAADGFDTELIVATTPNTRTTPSIQAKNAARTLAANLYRAVVRQLVQKFRQGTITGMMLNDAGVRVPDAGPTPINPPATVPLLTVVSAGPGFLTLRASDSTTPDSRRKPYGYAGLQLVRIVAPAAPVNGDGGVMVGQFSRQPMIVDSPPANLGEQCHYFARWYNAKGQMGPWSLVSSFVGT